MIVEIQYRGGGQRYKFVRYSAAAYQGIIHFSKQLFEPVLVIVQKTEPKY